MWSAGAAERLDERLRAWSRERDVSGAVLLTQAGETLFEGCYGAADRAAGSPVTPTTRFGLASVTKMFTAVAVADLVATGRLSFEARVVDLLPLDRQPTTLHPDVAVHHLLLHTSGIADYAEEDPESAGYLDDYASLWTDRPSYAMLRPADFLPLFADRPAYRPPGESWQYSNAGYVLLGLVLEEVTGRDYADVVQERVLDRAGMAASGFFRLDEARRDVAVGYLERSSLEEVWRTNVYSIPVVGGPDGGAFSTLGDLDRFLTLLADGTLLGPVTETVLAPRERLGDGYAHGYGVLHFPDGRWGHGGGDPGVEVSAQRFPGDDANLVVLCNTHGWSDDLRSAVLDAWRPVTGDPTAP
jgi:CubicO group peptidase (beta-lactamase class C family)